MSPTHHTPVAFACRIFAIALSGCFTAAALPGDMDAGDADVPDAGRGLDAPDGSVELDASGVEDAGRENCMDGAVRPCGDCYRGEQTCSSGRWESCTCRESIPCEESVYRGELRGTYRVGEGDAAVSLEVVSSEFVLHVVPDPSSEFQGVVIENGCLVAEALDPTQAGVTRAFVASVRGELSCQTGDLSAALSGTHAGGDADTHFEGPLTGNRTSMDTLRGEWVTRDDPAERTNDGEGEWTLTRISLGEPPSDWPQTCPALDTP